MDMGGEEMNDEQVLRVVDELFDRMFGELQREQETDERVWQVMATKEKDDAQEEIVKT
jgi:hypothetical protein